MRLASVDADAHRRRDFFVMLGGHVVDRGLKAVQRVIHRWINNASVEHQISDRPIAIARLRLRGEHGLIDRIVHRKKMRAEIAEFICYFCATQ